MANPSIEERTWPTDMQLEVAAQIMAGFAANPAIFAMNDRNGWALVNCTDDEVVGYANHLAARLITAAHTKEFSNVHG